MWSLLHALIALDSQLCADGLQDLHQYDQQGRCKELQHNIKAVIAVVDGDLAQTAAADDTGHSAVAHDGSGCDRHIRHKARHALGDHDLRDDLQRRCAHALGGLDTLITYGEQAKRTAVVAAAKGLTTLHANTYREAADALLKLMQPGDALLVKASRGMALEKVLELFYKEQP